MGPSVLLLATAFQDSQLLVLSASAVNIFNQSNSQTWVFGSFSLNQYPRYGIEYNR